MVHPFAGRHFMWPVLIPQQMFLAALAGTAATPATLNAATRVMMVVRVLLSISFASCGRGWFVRPSSARQAQPDRHPRGGLGPPSAMPSNPRLAGRLAE